jgi:hypothetical protein
MKNIWAKLVIIFFYIDVVSKYKVKIKTGGNIFNTKL